MWCSLILFCLVLLLVWVCFVCCVTSLETHRHFVILFLTLDINHFIYVIRYFFSLFCSGGCLLLLAGVVVVVMYALVILCGIHSVTQWFFDLCNFLHLHIFPLYLLPPNARTKRSKREKKKNENACKDFTDKNHSIIYIYFTYRHTHFITKRKMLFTHCCRL